jgi:CRP-like cAMP-binding protein
MDVDKAHKQLTSFFATGKELSFERRGTIIGYGESVTHAYLITEGCVKVMSYTASGSERIHYLYGPGELFPVTWLFGPKKFEISFTALSKVTIQQKPIKDVIEYFEKEPYALLAVLDQQSAAYGRIINLNLGTAEQRLAYRLITMASRFGKCEGDHYVVTLPLTMQELADMVRLTRETAGKIIAKFEQKGYVIFGRQQILIYPEELKKLSEE